MEERKRKEIEHSKQRREILQGFERFADTHAAEKIENLEELIKDKELFDYHFSNMKFYSITKSSEEHKRAWLTANAAPGVHVLDFACGNGENGIFAAQQGAKVTGIDISPEGIENAKKNAEMLGVAELCQFVEMDGESMSLGNDTFDLAVEYGALHHVDLDAALSELARVLKPDARMMCIEAMRHNPLIHAYRRRTPHLRTEWEVEHILGVESFNVMRKYFKEVNVRYFHLASLALVPFRNSRIFPLLLPIMDRIDQVLLSNKLIGKYGWIMAVELCQPIKA